MNLVLTKDQINELPLGAFPGTIHVVTRPSEAEPVLDLLENEQFLGFDTETRPSFRKGQNHPVALIQLASKDHAGLFRISQAGIPTRLKRVLQDRKIIKIAQEPAFELKKLYEEQHVLGQGFVDLSLISHKLHCSPRSLRALAAIFLGIRISKKAQTSNWERPQITPQQELYAATDAWVSREVFTKMLDKRYISDYAEFMITVNPEPPRRRTRRKGQVPGSRRSSSRRRPKI
jgi:ribonuclease D